jgi:hypothetical protein
MEEDEEAVEVAGEEGAAGHPRRHAFRIITNEITE